MRRSTNRILTTHVGSLPRPRNLIDLMIAGDNGETVDPAHYDTMLKEAVTATVQKQVDLGVDVVDDGELSKRGFAVYAHERLGGLEPTGKPRPSPWANSRESRDFPEFYEKSVQPFRGAPDPPGRVDEQVRSFTDVRLASRIQDQPQQQTHLSIVHH